MMQIRLRQLMQSDDGWGHEQGKEMYTKLRDLVKANPADLVFSISLAGVKRTDASFPREGVMKLAREHRGSRGFCLIDVSDRDILENWEAAATKLNQPITVWHHDKYRMIGPQPSEGTREMFEYVLSVPIASTSAAAKALGIKVSNASNKLKKLWGDGYILRSERIASTGGVEFEYFRVG